MTKKRLQQEETITEEVWRQILSEVKPRNHSVEALLKAARPTSFDGRTLTIEVFYKFHKERLEKEAYRSIVEQAASQIIKRSVRIVCLLSEKPKKPKEEDVANLESSVDEDIVKAAQEIFGGRLID